MADLKQLEMHPDKTGFILFGNKQRVENMRKEINENPLPFQNFMTKEKLTEKWIGDQITVYFFR